MSMSINHSVNDIINDDTLKMLRNACAEAESVEDIVKLFRIVYTIYDTDQDFKEYIFNDLFVKAYSRVKTNFAGDMDRFFKLLDEAVPMACPRKGAINGYKLGYCSPPWIDLETGLKRGPDYAIIELYIPEEAKRSSAFGKKCRCDKARVDKITRFGHVNERCLNIAYSIFDNRFEYPLNEWIEPTRDFDDNRFIECTRGIHFFMTIDDVIEYFKGLI